MRKCAVVLLCTAAAIHGAIQFNANFRQRQIMSCVRTTNAFFLLKTTDRYRDREEWGMNGEMLSRINRATGKC